MMLLWLACTPTETEPAPPTPPPSTLRERCFGDLGPDAVLVDYDRLGPTVPDHCLGSDHQDIDAVGKLVFLGDSITAGTPPSTLEEVYRTLVQVGIEERFGPVTVENCSEWGAEIDDVAGSQLEQCFAPVETEPVLVVFTIGGNDMLGWGQDIAGGESQASVQADFDAKLAMLADTLAWFRETDTFAGGVNVVFSNVYEFTDGTNDVGVCPLADIFNVPTDIAEFREGYVAINEAYMQMAIDTQTDMVFLFEEFCGHGFFHDDPTNPCYRGPDTPRWFDDTCIHPTPEGHRRLADMILAVVDQ